MVIEIKKNEKKIENKEKTPRKSTRNNVKKTPKKKDVKKIETSKKIILASYIIAIALTMLVIVGTFLSIDVTNLTTITALAYAELAASNVYYFKKAAKENVPKVIAGLPEFVRDQIDVNQLLNN